MLGYIREALVGFLILGLVAVVAFGVVSLMVEQNGVITQGSKTYNQTKNIEGNITGGTAGFFTFSNTYMTILGVTAIISIVGLIIWAVYYFGLVGEATSQQGL